MSEKNQDLLFEANPRAEAAEAEADKLAGLLARLLAILGIKIYPDSHPILNEVASALAARNKTNQDVKKT